MVTWVSAWAARSLAKRAPERQPSSLPRRKVKLAQEYGSRLAAAVETVLADGDAMQSIEGQLQTEFQEIDLKFD